MIRTRGSSLVDRPYICIHICSSASYKYRGEGIRGCVLFSTTTGQRSGPSPYSPSTLETVLFKRKCRNPPLVSTTCLSSTTRSPSYIRAFASVHNPRIPSKFAQASTRVPITSIHDIYPAYILLALYYPSIYKNP